MCVNTVAVNWVQCNPNSVRLLLPGWQNHLFELHHSLWCCNRMCGFINQSPKAQRRARFYLCESVKKKENVKPGMFNFSHYNLLPSWKENPATLQPETVTAIRRQSWNAAMFVCRRGCEGEFKHGRKIWFLLICDTWYKTGLRTVKRKENSRGRDEYVAASFSLLVFSVGTTKLLFLKADWTCRVVVSNGKCFCIYFLTRLGGFDLIDL